LGAAGAILAKSDPRGAGARIVSHLGGKAMKIGARSQLQGVVKEIKKGKVMCSVRVEIPAGGTMGSVVTLDSLDELGLKKGDKVRVVVKAVNVLLVKE
jgi:molybdopterin-binding protein